MKKSITGAKGYELKLDISKTISGELLSVFDELRIDPKQSYVNFKSVQNGNDSNGDIIWKKTDEVKNYVLTGKDNKAVELMESNGYSADDIQEIKVIVDASEKSEPLFDLIKEEKLDVVKLEGFYAVPVGSAYISKGKARAFINIEFHAENVVPVISKSSIQPIKREG